MAKRGRPIKSEIRQNIVEILYFLGEAYPYEVYQIYREVFPNVTMRSVYFQLKRGSEMGIFKVKKIKSFEGSYSWGPSAERVYYELGKLALPVGNLLVKAYLDKKK
jgi:hypothetical protein